MSKKAKPAKRFFKARMMTIFNPLFISGLGILSLTAFVIWQYWFSPDYAVKPIELSDPTTAQTNTNQNAPTETSLRPEQQEVNKVLSPDYKVPENSAQTTQNTAPITSSYETILKQNNPSAEIFAPIAGTGQRETRTNNTQGKLYEQLRNLPNLFPDLLPPQGTNSNLVDPLVGTNVPANQLSQYQLRNSGAIPPTTSALSQAVGQVITSNNPNRNNNNNSNNNNNNQQNNQPQNNQQSNNPPSTLPTLPYNTSSYGNYSPYTNYGSNPNVSPNQPGIYGNPYGNYGGMNQGGVYGGIRQGGYNNPNQLGFPRSGF